MRTDFVAFAPRRLLEEAVGELGEAVEEEEVVVVVVVVEEEVVEEEEVDRGVMATTSPKAQSRPERGPGPVRPLRAMPT